MAREDKTQYAILGALMHGPFSGYDLKKMINNSIGFFWSENYGRIYPVLGSLETKGFIKKQVIEQEKKPSKHLYTVTDGGREFFLKWLDKPAEFEKIRHELLLKIFFGNFSTDISNSEKLQTEIKFHSALLEKYAEIEKIMCGESQQTAEPSTPPIVNPQLQALSGQPSESQISLSPELQVQLQLQPHSQHEESEKYWKMTLEFGKLYSAMSIQWCREIIGAFADNCKNHNEIGK